MEVELKVGEEYKETKVVIYANKNSSKLTQIVEMLKSSGEQTILASANDQVYLLNLADIETFYAQESKVFARNNECTYQIKKRLYELEEILPQNFIRISNSEIVNFNKVEKLDMNFTGTICLIFKSSNQTYVSRRYIKAIKNYLKIKEGLL